MTFPTTPCESEEKDRKRESKKGRVDGKSGKGRITMKRKRLGVRWF